MDNRRRIHDRRRLIRRKEDRLIFQKEFVSLIESVEGLKKALEKFRQEGKNNEEAAKALEPLINNIEKEVFGLDKKISKVHTYWTKELD